VSDSWQSKFTEKLQARQQSRKELRRDFGAYQEMVVKLFELIMSKVSGIDTIQVQRPMPVRTDKFRENITGHIDTIKSMTLRCDGKLVEFVPEGINFDFGKGRVRILHKSKNLPDYLYLYLVVDPASTAEYPANLTWVIHDRDGELQAASSPFDEARIEALIEAAFLSE